MPANRNQLQLALQKPYDRILFAKDILKPIFNSYLSLNSSLVRPSIQPNQSESAVIDNVGIYGKITLEDSTEVICYEIVLKKNVRLEYNKVAIQHYVRKLLTVGQAALISFISPSYPNFWRLTLVAKDSVLTEKGITEKATNAKRYTYLLGPSETCKTPAERFELLSIETKLDLDILVKAFSVEKLSKAFFDEYTRHYENFITYLTKPANKKSLFNGDEKAIRDYSKKLLGRIVFLYFVQKKRWLGASDIQYKDGMADFIMQLFHLSGSNASFYPNWLTKLFFDTLNNERKEDAFEMPDGNKVKIPFLNGGLFDKEEHDDKIIPFPANLFHNHDNEDDPKERGFLDFLNAFNFTIYEDSPDEKTVAVDPEMLGHIFENLLEDNKDKGAFYTPKQIVHYMCQESLIEYLKTHLLVSHSDPELVEGEESLSIQNLVKHKNVDKYILQNAPKIDTLLDSVKICDPAIGSGAFPMGLLQEIYSIKEVIAYETGKEWKPAEVKENIIQNSIYGVDIEKGAVDIARLRFWLSLVVDEEKPKPLPNLDYKIVVGDSLVSKFDGEVVEIDWTRQNLSVGKGEEYAVKVKELLLQIAEKQKKYFHPEIKNKNKLTAEIRNLKIELLINQLSLNKYSFINKSPEVIDSGFGLTAKEKTKNTAIKLEIAKYDNLLKKLTVLKKQPEQPFNHFDWKLDFPEVLNPYLIGDNAGFDIVIGNPPYLNFKMYSSDSKNNYKHLYPDVFDGKGDVYYYFFRKAFNLSKTNGFTTFITSRYWIEAEFAKKLRKFFILHSNVKEIIDFKNVTVFDGLGIKTCITSFFKAKNTSRGFNYLYHSGKKIDYINLAEFTCNKIPTENVQKDSWNLTNEESTEIIELIEKDTIALDDIAFCKQGIVTGLDKAFITVDNEFKKLPKNIVKPWLKVGDIHKYAIVLVEKRELVYTKLIKNINEYPELKSRLLPFKKKLLNRREAKSGKIRWYDLQWPREQEIFDSQKLICRFKAQENTFCYDDTGYYSSADTTVVALNSKGKNLYSIKYLLALLNSKVLSFYFSTYGKLMDYRYEYYPGPVGKLRVKNYPNKLCFERVVDYIIFLKKQTRSNISDQLITAYFEQIIDGMVYELYFPELLKRHNREIIMHIEELPAITEEMSDQKKMKIITEVFNRLNAKDHPVRVNLFYMDSIPEIRIIEGKDADN